MTSRIIHPLLITFVIIITVKPSKSTISLIVGKLIVKCIHKKHSGFDCVGSISEDVHSCSTLTFLNKLVCHPGVQASCLFFKSSNICYCICQIYPTKIGDVSKIHSHLL